jgi:hypothetical protein
MVSEVENHKKKINSLYFYNDSAISLSRLVVDPRDGPHTVVTGTNTVDILLAF